MATNGWQVPPRDATEDVKLGWLKQTKTQAVAWLQSQRTYRDSAEAIALISGQDDDPLPDGMSQVVAGEVRRDIRELVETLANLRAISSCKTDNKPLSDNAAVINQLDQAWWFTTQPVVPIKGALQNAAVLGTGFIGTRWDPEFHSLGRGDVALDVYRPDQVLPVQLPPDHDYQKAYAVHIVAEVPIATAYRQFWKQAHKIVPDRESPTWMRKGLNSVRRFLSPVLNAFGAGRDVPDDDPIFPTVDIHYCYVNDPALNMTGKDIVMGEPGTLWEYTVPSMGTQVWSGINDPTNGQKLMRDVTSDEARLYPLRRLIVWCSAAVLYDDTSQWWHGQLPVTPIALDQWIWDAVGVPLTKDVANLEHSMTMLMRGLEDAAMLRINPPVSVDDNQVSEDLASEYSLRVPGQQFRLNNMMGEAIKPILPAAYYDMPSYIPDHIKYLEGRIQRIIAVTDAAALAKAKQIPSSDTIEKIREMAGPILVGMTNSLERALQKVGHQRMWLNFQFMTLQRRLQILGDDGILKEDIDYDPATLIPSHLPGEDPTKGPSRMTRLERAKWFASQFYFYVVPGSLAQITQMSQKLLYLQLNKMGFPMDPWTLAGVFGIPDFGPPPEGTHTVMERWIAWSRMREEAAARAAQSMPEKGAGGRPNTNAKSPHQVSKDGGTRTTTATS